MSSSSKTAREIPGFYYDEEKKKYFRITKDHPRKPTSASQNGKDQKNEDIPRIPAVKRKIGKNPLFKVLVEQEVKPLTTLNLERQYFMEHFKHLDIKKQCRSQKLDLTGAGLEEKVNISKLIKNKAHDKLTIVSKIKGSDHSLVQLYGMRSKKIRTLKLHSPFDLFVCHCTSISMTSTNSGLDQLLISNITSKGSEAEVVFLGQCHVRRLVKRMRKGQTIWASCFMPHSSSDQRIALATYGGVSVIEADSGRNYREMFINTTKSDVLALQYSKRSQSLFTGSRDKTIHGFDLRQPKHVAKARAKQSVDDMKVLNNEFHIIISTLAGHIELWDTRSWKPVISYPGHQNTHSMLQLHVDRNENFLASVGEDCMVRIWDLRNANLINCIPSFRFDLYDETVMPAISFIGDIESNVRNGLIYGIQDEIFLYPL